MVITKPDLDSPAHIREFVDAFYHRMLRDPELAPIFLDIAEIDLERHLPLIRAYWEKLLLGEKNYNRHTMNIHRAVHAKRALTQRDFERWLKLFCSTLDRNYSGPKAERARQVATHIATNMHNAMNPGSTVTEIEPAH